MDSYCVFVGGGVGKRVGWGVRDDGCRRLVLGRSSTYMIQKGILRYAIVVDRSHAFDCCTGGDNERRVS